MTNREKHYADILLSIEAVSLSPEDPFTWSSGLKAPIYCDNRLTMSYPELYRDIVSGLVELVKEHYPNATAIAGTATAGIPHAALIADRLELPMVYVRDKAKGHGKGNQIEGRLAEGSKVVMVEDLISTGGSVIRAAEAVREAGFDVLGAVAIMTYQLPIGTKAFADADLSHFTLTNYENLVEVASLNPDLAKFQESLLTWHQDPEAWSQAHTN
ncbi:orotate phosphoribosyltransferase [Aerococcaceae bacterium DSM 111176]|nr:orotate phosphoribosyltransferase [Aerococcaceae bacterium DSM 111176]